MGAFLRRVEEASLNAVVSLEQALYDGWVLRFARGFTKRRNSVNPLYESHLNAEDKIDVCEAQFAARELPSIFRLTPFALPAGLDARLAERGYAVLPDRVAVMTAALDPAAFAGPRGKATVARQGLAEWLPIHDAIGHIPGEQHALHRDLLARIPAACYFATTYDSIRAAACVLAVRENDLVGIYELVTAPDLRRKGHGADLVRTVLHWAMADGARHAYLQVAESNLAATALYRKMGFETRYGYWYRAKNAAR